MRERMGEKYRSLVGHIRHEPLQPGNSIIFLRMLQVTHGKIGQKHSATFCILKKD
jgi:hypothetical protein